MSAQAASGNSTESSTVIETEGRDGAAAAAAAAEDHHQQQTVVLKLKKPKSEKKVEWTSETVDNENLGRKKSKCCCVYRKPRAFGESSSEDSDGDADCDHCTGHKDHKKDRPTD